MKIDVRETELVISEITECIPVDDSEFGKRQKEFMYSVMPDVHKLAEAAKEHGYDMPAEGFIYNYEAWQLDYKSYYHHQGVNCFTPCKCNPLSFSLSKGEGKTMYV